MTVKTYRRAQEAKSEVNSSRNMANPSAAPRDIPHPSGELFLHQRVHGRASGPEIGRFPGANDAHFVDRCSAFFARQLAVAQPRLILMLGMEPLRALAKACCKTGGSSPGFMRAGHLAGWRFLQFCPCGLPRLLNQAHLISWRTRRTFSRFQDSS